MLQFENFVDIGILLWGVIMLSIKKLLVKMLRLEYYTSLLDQFLHQYREKHPRLSAAQRQEQTKYQRINELRDNPKDQPSPPSFWEAF